MSATPPKPGSNSLSNHPLNLALAFALELVMLGALIYWGWTQHDGILRIVLAVGLPLIAATVWGVFRVDNDPNKAVVIIPGGCACCSNGACSRWRRCCWQRQARPPPR